MESSESHEPSYYEVALTNRQVLIAFVVLLTSIVAAFLSGVWIGREGSPDARSPAAITDAAAASTEPPLEQLTFFNGKEAGSRTGKNANVAPSPAPVTSGAREAAASANTAGAASSSASSSGSPADTAADDSATEEMRQHLDAAMAASRTPPPPPAASPPIAETPPAGTRVTAKPSPPASASVKPAAATKDAPSAKPAVAGKTFVQVYSSTNGARAKEIVAQLRKAGFPVVMAEAPKGSATTYRVRVGPYSDRAKADNAAGRLRQDFRLETWVTDSP